MAWKKEATRLTQRSVLGNDRPAGTQLYKHVFWNPPNSSRHFAKINQHITILESFQEFITKKTAGGSKVLHFFTLWVRMKTKYHGIISSSLSQPAGSETGTLPSCNVENIESSWVRSVHCDKRTKKDVTPNQRPAWFFASQAGKWPAQNGRITEQEAVAVSLVFSCSMSRSCSFTMGRPS